VSELIKKPDHPVQPTDHNHLPGQGPGQDAKRAPDKPANPAVDQHQAGPPAGAASGRADVQGYMNLDKQGANTQPQTQLAHSGADATPLQTPDTSQAAARPADTGHGAISPADAGHPAGPGHTADAAHPADTTHPADATRSTDTKHPAETKQPADAQHGPNSAAARTPGTGSAATDHAPNTRDARDARAAPETPADRDMRLHLQPFGVTPEQARDYMRVVLVPQLQLDPMTKMAAADLKRVGDAVSHLNPQQLDHLTAQAKGLDTANPAAGHQPGRQTLDTSRLSAVPRFGFDGPAAKVDYSKSSLLGGSPQIKPSPPNSSSILQSGPKPPDQQSQFAKDTAKYAAQGMPGHRVADVPDSERVKEGDWGQVAEYLGDVSGATRLADRIKSESANLSPELTRHPLVAAALVINLATILGGATAADLKTQHPIDPNAPRPTGGSATSALGELLGGSHVAQIGGLAALNQLLDHLGTHIYLEGSVDHGKTEGTIGVRFKLP
jgi:hypothetical protein